MHSVRFYEDDDVLIDAAARFAMDGFSRGHAFFSIATSAHAAALRERLAAAGLDPGALAAAARYAELDADATLASIGGGRDAVAFERIVGRPILDAAARCGGVSAFGEMIPRLCAAGRTEEALGLERLWCGLCDRAPLDLLCAYRVEDFMHGDGERLLQTVCSLRVEALAAPADLPGAMRGHLDEWLRRHAQALECEVALRRALQKRLERRDRELTDFLENGAEPLHMLDAEGRILWANRAELELLGYAEDEYLGHDLAEFHVDPELARNCLHRLTDGETVRDVPVRLRCRDGSVRHVLVSSNAFRVDGRFVYARCFSRDVSALVQAEQRQREELEAWEVVRRTSAALNSELDVERLMQTLIDAAVQLTHARCGVLLLQCRSAAAEPSWLRATAGPVDVLPQDFPPDVAPAPSTVPGGRVVRRDGLLHDMAAAPAAGSFLAASLVSRSGQVRGGLYLFHPEPGRFVRRDEIVLEGIASQGAIALDNARLFEANEHARAEQGALNETLERRIVERTEELHRSEQQLNQLLSGIADYAIFLLDADGRVLTWNTGAERIGGYTAREIVGQSFALFYPPEERAAGMPQKALAIARAEGKYETEAWRMRKDGSRFWASVLLDAIHDRSGAVVGFAKVTRDMTERRAIEEQLQQAQRMEAIGRMTGGVAHDFNNLLTIIIGNLDTICREADLRPKVRSAAEHALRGARRATALTQQLLAFSRRQPLNPAPTDVNRLVAGTAELIKRTIGESIAIVTELAADLPTCDVDAAQLESALINLAMNARDAMPTGGRLTLSTASVRGADASPPSHDCVSISVADTGVGMDADVRKHAFEPFFTTKPAGRGTGLGLSQVYGFVKQSGGGVKLHSEPRRGTTVTITLPCPPAEIVAVEETAALEAPLGSGTVLLVEDNEDVRRYSAGVLRELGFDPLEAADGETALGLVRQRPHVRLLFTDIGLPGIDGLQLAERARELRPGLKVLFTTGYAHHSLALATRPGRHSALLKKPYMRAQLTDAVRELLDGDGGPARLPRALLVEDDAMLRDLTARMLERMGFEVVHADSLAVAMDEVAGGNRFDFALVDRGLGDGDGIAVVRALRATCPPTPALLSSGYGEADVEDGDEPLETLRKPYGYNTLADAIARLGVRVEESAGRDR